MGRTTRFSARSRTLPAVAHAAALTLLVGTLTAAPARAQQIRVTVNETPIVFENRRAGLSKINKKEAVKALEIIARLGVARALGRARMGRATS